MHKTNRGKPFDMNAFIQKNQNTVAVGSLDPTGKKLTNARGDLLGKGGKVIKKREEVVRDYYRTPPTKQASGSVKDNVDSMTFETPKEAIARLEKEKAEKEENKSSSAKTKTKKTDD